MEDVTILRPCSMSFGLYVCLAIFTKSSNVKISTVSLGNLFAYRIHFGNPSFVKATYDEVLSAQVGATDVRVGVDAVHGQGEPPLFRLREHFLTVPTGLLVPELVHSL